MDRSTRLAACLLALLIAFAAFSASAATVNIAAVNNPAMIELKKLSEKFEARHPEIKLNWVIVEENVLRQRVTTDIATGSGQFDLVFLGLYEAPIFAKRGWLREMKNIPKSYELDDVFQSLRDGLSYGGRLYGLPFYAESSMLMYRKDLFAAKKLVMPEQPTYEDVKRFAAALNDKAAGVYGIALRGQPGWGENMSLITNMVNTFGGAWFDMNWRPLIDSPEWRKAVSFYVDLVRNYGPPGAAANGFNENLTLFASGKAAMWIDATVGASALFDKSQSKVADKVGFANAPIAVTPRGSRWLWCWEFAVPRAAHEPDAAEQFAIWATSKDYIKLVAADTGWATVPPGTRKSTYANPEYQKAAPFAAVTLASMQAADPKHPCSRPVPYLGVQFVGIPEFQSFGTVAGQNIAGALTGNMTVEQALRASQAAAFRAVRQGGYLK
ncbi:MAG TPA: sugar ABC transporter substrate-binding protein [Verrucomicrobiae bacterium]|nr:sugar ABC transporter substrate-binding protein [Verrucomicrobiae bacterium]